MKRYLIILLLLILIIDNYYILYCEDNVVYDNYEFNRNSKDIFRIGYNGQFFHYKLENNNDKINDLKGFINGEFFSYESSEKKPIYYQFGVDFNFNKVSCELKDSSYNYINDKVKVFYAKVLFKIGFPSCINIEKHFYIMPVLGYSFMYYGRSPIDNQPYGFGTDQFRHNLTLGMESSMQPLKWLKVGLKASLSFSFYSKVIIGNSDFLKTPSDYNYKPTSYPVVNFSIPMDFYYEQDHFCFEPYYEGVSYGGATLSDYSSSNSFRSFGFKVGYCMPMDFSSLFSRHDKEGECSPTSK